MPCVYSEHPGYMGPAMLFQTLAAREMDEVGTTLYKLLLFRFCRSFIGFVDGFMDLLDTTIISVNECFGHVFTQKCINFNPQPILYPPVHQALR